MNSKILYILAAGTLFLTSCDKDLWEFADKDKGAYVSEQESPISTTLSANENYSEWVKVLEYSDLYATLNSQYDASTKTVKFTMFAPTNTAMQSFYQEKGVSSIEDLGTAYAKAMVRTMTYSGDSIDFSEKFTAKVTSLVYAMVAGETVSFSVDPNEPGYLLNEKIHCSYDHIACSNGFIYTTEGVVKPLVETLWDRLVESGSNSIMQQAITETGYQKMLNTVADTTLVLGSFKYTYFNYSLLNVSDATFKQAGINSLSDLKNAILSHSKTPELGADSLLRQYVQYHILDSRYALSEITQMNGEDTIAIVSKTLAPNQIFMVTRHYTGDSILVDGEMVASYDSYLNVDDISGQAFDTSMSNITAKNGYLHQLSGWMPVYEPSQTTVVWDLADYSQVRQAVGPEHYRPDAVESNETKVDVSRLSCYTVDYPNGRANTNYSELCYVTCKSNLKDCLYHDRLVLNMGYLGSVTMKSPTLVKGKYKVTVNMAYLVDQSSMRTSSGCKGGLIKILVDRPEDFDPSNDDEENYHKVRVAPYTQISKSQPGVYTGTLYEEIEFDETASHDFTFTILDPAANDKKIYLQFDIITFTPITE